MSITKILAKTISNYDSNNSIGSKLRAKRIAPLLSMIESVYKENGCVNIIDIGGTKRYWGVISQDYLKKYNVRITIVNIPGTDMPQDEDIFSFLTADGCDLKSITSNSYHIAHSNSVIEHVGDWDRMIMFANEISRIAPKYFVQTPNFWFPLEPHCMTPCFHWLPRPLCIWLVSHFALGQWKKAGTVDAAVRQVDSARLLNRKMFQTLFNDARIKTETVMYLPKSLIAIRHKP